MLPNEIHCSGSFPLEELPKEELACKMKQQKRWGGGSIVSETDMQAYSIYTNKLQAK